MQIDKFTTKAQETLMRTQALASKNNQQIDPLHLAISLISQKQGTPFKVLQKIGTEIESLEKKLQEEAQKLSRVIMESQQKPQVQPNQDGSQSIDSQHSPSIPLLLLPDPHLLQRPKARQASGIPSIS